MAEIITGTDARYALELVETICSQAGPGVPGSEQERQRAAIIQKELEARLGAENVSVEEFGLAPGAFLNPYPGLCILIAAVLNVGMGRLGGVPPWLTSSLSLVFAAAAALLFVFEFLFGFEFVDPLFPKGKSVNVIGKLRKPGTEGVTRLLMLSGHHDSAWEDNWIRLLGYGFFFASATFFLGLIAMLAMSLVQLAGVIADDAGTVRLGTLGWVLLVYPIVPAAIFTLFSHRRAKDGGVVPGAVDNLSASALTVAMCGFLVNNPSFIPADTEIRFISFGSEEAGLRGSRRYVARHLDELKRLDARLLNFEMVAYPEIILLTSDMNGTLKNSPEMVKGAVAAARRAGVPYKVKPASLGTGTDAAPFTRAGLKAMTLLPFKVPEQMVAFYHQRRDRPEALTIEPLLNVLKLSLEWVRIRGEEQS